MMSVIAEAFRMLKTAGCVSSQREFSTAWLGKRPSYFSSMLARGVARRPSTNVLLTLYSRIRNYVEDAGVVEPNQRQMLHLVADQIWAATMDCVSRRSG